MGGYASYKRGFTIGVSTHNRDTQELLELRRVMHSAGIDTQAAVLNTRIMDDKRDHRSWTGERFVPQATTPIGERARWDDVRERP